MLNASRNLIAIVGMPGAGKSEVVSNLKQKGFIAIRFGDITEEELSKKGSPVTPENEQTMRESLRKEFGMDIYAKKSQKKIKEALASQTSVVIDGLYSWEEYLFLKDQFPQLQLVLVYAEPTIRYERLAKRPVRPFTAEEARKRDIAEIENLGKGGPIAIADYLVENNSGREDLYKKLDELFKN